MELDETYFSNGDSNLPVLHLEDLPGFEVPPMYYTDSSSSEELAFPWMDPSQPTWILPVRSFDKDLSKEMTIKEFHSGRISSSSSPDEDHGSESHPGNKSEFKFVIKTGKPSVKTAQERLLVRSHAMHAFIREKKAAAEGEHFEFQSGTAKNTSTTQGEGQGKFKLSTWSRKSSKRISMASQSGDILRSPKKRTGKGKKSSDVNNDIKPLSSSTKLMRQKPQRAPEVSSILDPFNALPIAINEYSQKLFHHYNTSFTINSVVINHEGTWISFAMTNDALFHATMSLVSLHYNLIGGKWDLTNDSSNVLYHKVEAIKKLNILMKHDEQRVSDISIGIIALLANFESVNGSIESAGIHMTGLEQIVNLRGGLEAFGHNRVLLRVLIWCDIGYATTWDRPTHFVLPSSSQPIHAALEKFSSSHLRSSKSIIFINPSWCLSHPSMLLVLETLRRITTAISTPVARLTSADRRAISDAVNSIEYKLLSFRGSSPQVLSLPSSISTSPQETSYFDARAPLSSFPFPTEAQEQQAQEAVDGLPSYFEPDFSEPFRIASLLYTHIIIREIPASAKMHHLLVNKLNFNLQLLRQDYQASLSLNPDLEPFSRDIVVLLLWIIFMGTIAALTSDEKDDFLDSLVWASELLLDEDIQIRGRSKQYLEELLSQIAWLPAVGTPHLERVWRALGGRQR